MDSLAFPGGHLPGVAEAIKRIPLGSVDVVMTNPPFGTDIKIEDPDVLDRVPATAWRSPGPATRRPARSVAGANAVGAMAPEQLFIQRAVQWVRPGGTDRDRLAERHPVQPRTRRRGHPRAGSCGTAGCWPASSFR